MIGAGLGCQPGSSFGILQVGVQGGSVYFVREVRGLHYDALVLSASPDICQDMHGGSNFVFREVGTHRPYYRWDGQSLHLYTTGEVERPHSFPVPVVVHTVGPREWQEIERSADSTNLIRVNVELGATAPCRIRGY